MSPRIVGEGDPSKMGVVRDLVIDNGSDKVAIDIAKLERDLCSFGLTPEIASSITKKIADFALEVRSEKAKGAHLGSDSLTNAVHSLLFEGRPEDFGFRTEAERDAVADIIEKATRRQLIRTDR